MTHKNRSVQGVIWPTSAQQRLYYGSAPELMTHVHKLKTQKTTQTVLPGSTMQRLYKKWHKPSVESQRGPEQTVAATPPTD